MASPHFGPHDHVSSFGPPMPQGPVPPGLAAHYAQQAFQHAQRQPQNQGAQQQAAAWAHAAAGAQTAPGAIPSTMPTGSVAFNIPGTAPGMTPNYVGYEPPTPPHETHAHNPQYDQQKHYEGFLGDSLSQKVSGVGISLDLAKIQVFR